MINRKLRSLSVLLHDVETLFLQLPREPRHELRHDDVLDVPHVPRQAQRALQHPFAGGRLALEEQRLRHVHERLGKVGVEGDGPVDVAAREELLVELQVAAGGVDKGQRVLGVHGVGPAELRQRAVEVSALGLHLAEAQQQVQPALRLGMAAWLRERSSRGGLQDAQGGFGRVGVGAENSHTLQLE